MILTISLLLLKKKHIDFAEELKDPNIYPSVYCEYTLFQDSGQERDKAFDTAYEAE